MPKCSEQAESDARYSVMPHSRQQCHRYASTFALLLLFLIPGFAQAAENCSIPAALANSRPDSGGPPTVVNLILLVIEIKEINDVDQYFTAHFLLDARWKDPRLATSNLAVDNRSCRWSLDSIWSPRLAFVNGEKLDTYRNDIDSVSEDGEVRHIQRHIGIFSSDFDLRQFPQDSQDLVISVVAGGHSTDQVRFLVNEEGPVFDHIKAIPGWDISGGSSALNTLNVTALGTEMSQAQYMLTVERRLGYYIWKVIVPLGLIVAMSWAVFWIDPAHLGPQVTLSSAAVFALIAFQLSLGFMLPKISYLTRIDIYVLGSTILVFAALAEGVLTARLTATGRGPAARSLDRALRWAFPAVFLMIVSIAFWL